MTTLYTSQFNLYQAPIYELPDPFQASLANSINRMALPTINVKLPIDYLGVSINSSEVVLEADLGS